jgi:hypothetical protein
MEMRVVATKKRSGEERRRELMKRNGETGEQLAAPLVFFLRYPVTAVAGKRKEKKKQRAAKTHNGEPFRLRLLRICTLAAL